MKPEALPRDHTGDTAAAGGHAFLPLAQVASLAALTAESTETFFSTLNSAVLRELRDIDIYVQTIRREIEHLQAHELKQTRIPAAGQELDAVVQATETAAHTIMDHAEAVMAAECGDAAAYKALVDRTMLAVFEACSFQDIAGQRIAKVAETLRHIEERVSRLAAVAAGVPETRDDADGPHADRKRHLLLGGPALPGEGVAQSDIDDIFNDN
jgi:chemotaxis protein CheZ